MSEAAVQPPPPCLADRDSPTICLLRVVANFGNADRRERAVHWRRFHAAVGHQLAKKKAGLRVRDSRLHTDAHEAVSVVNGLPRVDSEATAGVVAGHPEVACVELGARVDEHL